MIKQECIGIPDMILLLMIFCFKKIKIKAEIVLSPGGAYFFIGDTKSRVWLPFRYPVGISAFQKSCRGSKIAVPDPLDDPIPDVKDSATLTRFSENPCLFPAFPTQQS